MNLHSQAEERLHRLLHEQTAFFASNGYIRLKVPSQYSYCCVGCGQRPASITLYGKEIRTFLENTSAHDVSVAIYELLLPEAMIPFMKSTSFTFICPACNGVFS
jgi:hypothetical protein